MCETVAADCAIVRCPGWLHLTSSLGCFEYKRNQDGSASHVLIPGKHRQKSSFSHFTLTKVDSDHMLGYQTQRRSVCSMKPSSSICSRKPYISIAKYIQICVHVWRYIHGTRNTWHTKLPSLILHLGPAPAPFRTQRGRCLALDHREASSQGLASGKR